MHQVCPAAHIYTTLTAEVELQQRTDNQAAPHTAALREHKKKKTINGC